MTGRTIKFVSRGIVAGINRNPQPMSVATSRRGDAQADLNRSSNPSPPFPGDKVEIMPAGVRVDGVLLSATRRGIQWTGKAGQMSQIPYGKFVARTGRSLADRDAHTTKLR